MAETERAAAAQDKAVAAIATEEAEKDTAACVRRRLVIQRNAHA